MSDKPTGVFVQLPVTDEQAQEMYRAYCAAYASSSLTTRGIATQAALFEVGTLVHSSNLDPSRECFEKFYAQMCARATGHDAMPEYVSGLRTGDTYGGRTFLNNVWQAWPEYVQYSQAQIAALEAEVVRLRERYGAIRWRFIQDARIEGRTLTERQFDALVDNDDEAHKALKGGAA